MIQNRVFTGQFANTIDFTKLLEESLFIVTIVVNSFRFVDQSASRHELKVIVCVKDTSTESNGRDMPFASCPEANDHTLLAFLKACLVRILNHRRIEKSG